MKMTRAELEAKAIEMLGGNPRDFDLDRLQELITVTQYATDVMLNEIERRGELTFEGGVPIVPYMSNWAVETILTRR